MLEYYTDLDVHTTEEELVNSIHVYLLHNGYKWGKSKKNRRYVRSLPKGEFFTTRNSFEPDIEVGYFKGKIRLFWKLHLSVKVFMCFWLCGCLAFQGLIFADMYQSGSGVVFHFSLFIPTFMFLVGFLFSSLALFITAKIRLGELKRGIGCSDDLKFKIKTLKQS